jgi:hypothetical protein
MLWCNAECRIGACGARAPFTWQRPQVRNLSRPPAQTPSWDSAATPVASSLPANHQQWSLWRFKCCPLWESCGFPCPTRRRTRPGAAQCQAGLDPPSPMPCGPSMDQHPLHNERWQRSFGTVVSKSYVRGLSAARCDTWTSLRWGKQKRGQSVPGRAWSVALTLRPVTAI